MCEVCKWHCKEDVFFLDRVLAQKCNQNEYNFLRKAGHMAKSVNLAVGQSVLRCETRVLMVVTGDVEGWDVAQLLEDETALVFEVHKDRLQAACKCVK
jgi:hypothetical protein